MDPEHHSHSKSFLFIGLVLVVGTLIYWVGLKNFNPPFEGDFRGSFVKVEGNKLTLHGTFLSPVSLAGDLKGSRDFSFFLDESTIINKISIELPSYGSLQASGETSRTFNFEDLPKKEAPGSVDDLKNLKATNALFDVRFLVSKNDLTKVRALSVKYQALTTTP